MTLSNNPPRSAEEFQSDIDRITSVIERWAETEVTAENAEQLHADINEASGLKKEADKAHKDIKEPWLIGGRKVDDEFRPVRTGFDAAVKKLKAFMSAYLVAEQKRKDEEARKAREEAERKAAEASIFADDPILGSDVVDPADAEKQAERAERHAANAGKMSSGAGRTVSLRTVYEPEVTDPVSLVNHFASHPDVQAAAIKVAAAQIRAAKGDVSIPGLNVVETQKAA